MHIKEKLNIGDEIMKKLEEQNNLLIYKDKDANMLEKIKTSCNYVSTNSSIFIFIY